MYKVASPPPRPGGQGGIESRKSSGEGEGKRETREKKEISQQWLSGPPPLSLKNVQNYCILYIFEAEDGNFSLLRSSADVIWKRLATRAT